MGDWLAGRAALNNGESAALLGMVMVMVRVRGTREAYEGGGDEGFFGDADGDGVAAGEGRVWGG